MPDNTIQEEQTASANDGNAAAEPIENGQEIGEFKAEEKQENLGAFNGKEDEDKKPEKSPGYTPLDWGRESNVSDWLVGMFSGRLQNWFLANLKWAGYYVDKGLNKIDKRIDRRDERKKLKDAEKGKDGPGKSKGEKDKPEKSKGEKGKPEKTSARDKNAYKAQKAKERADKAKKNMANRKYDNSDAGKNQKAFDQMTATSLEHEAAYRAKVAANPDYAASAEGRKAKAELIGDRKALAEMQRETGVDSKIVDGNIKKKPDLKKVAKRAKVGLKAAGAAIKDQKKKIAGKVKQAQQKGAKKSRQKANIKSLNNLKSQMKKMFQQKANTQNRQQGNTMSDAARRKQNAGR